MLTFQGPAYQDTLHRLSHIQPRAPKGVYRGKMPRSSSHWTISEVCVPDQQQAQGRKGHRQGVCQASLPTRSHLWVQFRGQRWGRWQHGQDRTQFFFEPRMQNRIRTAQYACDPHLIHRWMKQGQPLRDPIADVFVIIAFRFPQRPPTLP